MHSSTAETPNQTNPDALVWKEDDLQDFFNRRRTFREEWIRTLEKKQHPHRWVSLINATEEIQPGQLSPLLNKVYGQDKEARKKALLALKELFVFTDSEKSTVCWQKPLILAAIDAAIKDPNQIHLVRTWFDCTRPRCPRRQIRFQRLLCDSLAICPSEARPGLADNIRNYLCTNKTENQASNLFFFFSAIAEYASLDFAKAYFQENAVLLSVFCKKDASLNETIQSANNSAELQNSLLRLRLCKLYPKYRNVILQAAPYSEAGARDATETLLKLDDSLEALLPLLAAGGSIKAQNGEGYHALLEAAAKGHLKVVQCLLDAGAAVNAQTNDGLPPLHGAIKKGHFEVVKCLLNAGAAANIQTNDGWTALDMAGTLYEEKIKTIQHLWNTGAQNTRNNDGELTLVRATTAALKCLETKEALINKCDEVTLADAATNEEKQHPNRWMSLISANEKRKLDQQSPLLKDVDSEDKKTRKKALNELKAIFASVNTDARGMCWQKPLILAAIDAAIKDSDQIHLVHTWLDCTQPRCFKRQVRFQRLLCDSLVLCPSEVIPDLADNVLNYLCANKAENHESNLFFFFSAIAEYASLDFAKAYLQESAVFFSDFCEENAPLTEIIQNANSSAELQNRLLRLRLCKLYPEHRDVLQAIPYSAEIARAATVALSNNPPSTLENLLPLLARGAKIVKDEDNCKTPLMLAAYKGDINVVQGLLAAGAPINIKDDNGNTALTLAAVKGHFDIVRCLFNAGAALDIKDEGNQAALMLAATG